MDIETLTERVIREARRLTHKSPNGSWTFPELENLLPGALADLSGTDRRTLEHAARRSAHVEAVARLARELTHEQLGKVSPTGMWRLPELEKRVQRSGVKQSLRTHQEPLRTLIQEGDVARYGSHSSTEYTTPVHRVSLADLRDLASRRVKAGTGQVGRRPKSGSRAVEYVTKSNLERINALCTKIAQFLDANREKDDVLKEVTGDYFVWNEADEEWTNFRELCRAATERAGLAVSTRNQYVSAGTKMLDLAATHGWIAKSPRHDSDYEPVPADWAELFSLWRTELIGEGVDRVQSGLMTLFEACSRLDEHPSCAEWDAVIEHLEDWFRGNDVDSRNRSAVRKTYRVLRRKKLIMGPGWDGRRRQRQEGTTLLSSSAIEWVATRYGRGPGGTEEGMRSALTESAFPWEGWDQYEDGLVSGTYGLRRAMLFFTALTTQAEMLDLPSRGVFPRERIRGSSPKTLNRWKVATMKSNVQSLLHLAGWLSEERGVDWEKEDLRCLLNIDHLGAYRRQVYAYDDFGSRRSLERLLTVVARLASPYLETVALAQGDEELANRMHHVSAKVSASTAVDGRPSWLASLRQEKQEDNLERTRTKARQVENAWTRGHPDAEFAYQQMHAVRERLVDLLEQSNGPLEDQVERLQLGEQFDREWAEQVQDALYWQDQLTVPLRGFTSRWLDVAERIHSKDFALIRAEIPPPKLKESANGPFHPNYCTSPGGSYRLELYRLHVMNGGAREILRTTPSGEHLPVSAFYVPDVTQFAEEKQRLETANLRHMVWRIVQRAEDALGNLTAEEIQDAGGLGTHFFRHAFATFLVRRRRPSVAKEYLHHASMDMLEKVYAASGAEDYPVDVYLQEALDAERGRRAGRRGGRSFENGSTQAA